MAITITRGAAASGAAGTTNVELTLGTAPPQDSLLLAHVSGSNDHTVAAGWVQLGTTLLSVDRYAMFAKICGAAESTTQTPCTTPGNWSLALLEAAGTHTAIGSVFDVGTQNVDDDATKTTTGACDPTDGVERLVVGGAFTDGNRTWTVGSHQINGSTAGLTVQNGAGAGTASTGCVCTLFARVDASTTSGDYSAQAVASAADNGGASVTLWNPPAAPAPSLAPPPAPPPGARHLLVR